LAKVTRGLSDEVPGAIGRWVGRFALWLVQVITVQAGERELNLGSCKKRAVDIKRLGAGRARAIVKYLTGPPLTIETRRIRQDSASEKKKGD